MGRNGEMERSISIGPVQPKKRSTSKGGTLFSKLFRLDRFDPFSFRPKFPEILVEWIAPTDKGGVDVDYIFECDWLIQLSGNKLSNNKLSNNKLSDNLASKLVENRTFLN